MFGRSDSEIETLSAAKRKAAFSASGPGLYRSGESSVLASWVPKDSRSWAISERRSVGILAMAIPRISSWPAGECASPQAKPRPNQSVRGQPPTRSGIIALRVCPSDERKSVTFPKDGRCPGAPGSRTQASSKVASYGWGSSMVYRILCNPLYIISGEDDKQTRFHPQSKYPFAYHLNMSGEE